MTIPIDQDIDKLEKMGYRVNRSFDRAGVKSTIKRLKEHGYNVTSPSNITRNIGVLALVVILIAGLVVVINVFFVETQLFSAEVLIAALAFAALIKGLSFQEEELALTRNELRRAAQSQVDSYAAFLSQLDTLKMQAEAQKRNADVAACLAFIQYADSILDQVDPLGGTHIELRRHRAKCAELILENAHAITIENGAAHA